MTRLEKELRKRGIIGCNDEIEVYRTGIECERVLVSADNNFIVVASFTNVLDPVLVIHDARTFEPLCEQLLRKSDNKLLFDGDFNPWEVAFYVTEEEWEAQFENC